MRKDKRITPSDLHREADRLIATGKMPGLDRLLTVFAEVRTKYTPAIKKARGRK